MMLGGTSPMQWSSHDSELENRKCMKKRETGTCMVP